MTYKDIVTKRTYTKDGQEKTIWLNVGTLRVTDEGKEFIELNMFPDTSFYVFKKEPKEKQPTLEEIAEVKERIDFTPNVNVDVSDIPF